MSGWSPNSFEDKLLLTYYRKVGGRIYTEVPAPHRKGNKEWSDNYCNRFIDAIRIINSDLEDSIIPFMNHGNELLKRQKMLLLS